MFSVGTRCIKCHREMPGAHLFALHPEICRRCLTSNGKAESFFPHIHRNKRALNNTFITHEIPVYTDIVDPLIYYRTLADEIRTVLRNALQIHTVSKWRIRAFTVFERMEDDALVSRPFEFYSEPQILLRDDMIDAQLDSAISQIQAQIVEMGERESDLVFKTVTSTSIELARYNPV